MYKMCEDIGEQQKGDFETLKKGKEPNVGQTHIDTAVCSCSFQDTPYCIRHRG